jgi:uncharacterized protein DUF6390
VHPGAWAREGIGRSDVTATNADERGASGRNRANGPVLFARYAYPPNALGYCGPADAADLFGAAAAGTDIRHLRHLATSFEGAWPYLELIAAANHIDDPLDARVVEAYWLGNPLVRRVPPTLLAASLDERFGRRSGARFDSLVGAVPAGGVPQHSFHVFAVYPWVGLLRAGKVDAPLQVLDQCRIRWGRVEAVAGDWATVRCQGLVFDGSRLSLGPERTDEARHGVGGVGLIGPLAPGDIVALHWDWVCDRLSAATLHWLRYCTARNLTAVNAQAQPGPAIVCDV